MESSLTLVMGIFPRYSKRNFNPLKDVLNLTWTEVTKVEILPMIY